MPAHFASVQKKTSIPIPNIIDWNDDASNTIGSEYIIMGHADGTPLYQKWHDMAGDQRARCIGALYEKLGEMAKLQFPAYGSIYFSNNTAANSLIQLPDSAFSIGPNCGTRYWDYNEPRYYEIAGPNRGPCMSNPFCLLTYKVAHTGQGLLFTHTVTGWSTLASREFHSKMISKSSQYTTVPLKSTSNSSNMLVLW